jgi:glycerol kinase
MMNTGSGEPVPSKNGLLTTVAYQLGKDKPAVYALEGSVAFSGSIIQWLRDQLKIIESASESETEARKVSTNEDLYFVPAFAGLFAPYWRDDARGCIVGMTATHTKAHICRAALEATAFQAGELFDAMYHDSSTRLQVLKVDGGATANSLLMQFQADMINVPVVAPKVIETTAVGAAFAAGLAVGVWERYVKTCSIFFDIL